MRQTIGVRRIRYVVVTVAIVGAYLLLRHYADTSRSMEAVLGLYHGDPRVNAAVTVGVLVLRVVAYAVAGGVALAWPVDEILCALEDRQRKK